MSQTKPIIQSLPEVWDGPIICLEMREDGGQVHLTQEHSSSKASRGQFARVLSPPDAEAWPASDEMQAQVSSPPERDQ